MAAGDDILKALAANQAADFNSSPFSQGFNKDLTEIGSSIAAALMAPGDALNGQLSQVEIAPDGSVNPFSAPLMNAASNMAGVVSLGSAPMVRPSGSLGMGGFEKWFGNSQVRNPDGTPMKVYHGTTGNFDEFRIPVDGAGNQRAVYFTPDPAVASKYAAGRGSVVPAYVKADKLLTVDLQGGSVDALGRSREAIVRQAKADGYDGVLLKNTADVGGVQDQYAVFNPTQIKSATGNSGAYNASDPSIVRLSGVPIVTGDENSKR